MIPLDYARSFVLGAAGNRVRFWTEARARVFDGDDYEDMVWTAPCKSEHTFGADDLFTPDNYDGSRIFGPNKVVWYRKRSVVRTPFSERIASWRMLYEPQEVFGGQIYHHQPAAGWEELTTAAAVCAATYAFLPIVGQTELHDSATGLRAIIEYPVKTLNTISAADLETMRRARQTGAATYRLRAVGTDTDAAADAGTGPDAGASAAPPVFQVDTGPVPFPDLTRRHQPTEAGLALAFVAFNRWDRADFIVDRPTPVLDTDGIHEVCQVHHYSERLSLPARNRLYALQD